jgi:hypothetical protein
LERRLGKTCSWSECQFGGASLSRGRSVSQMPHTLAHPCCYLSTSRSRRRYSATTSIAHATVRRPGRLLCGSNGLQEYPSVRMSIWVVDNETYISRYINLSVCWVYSPVTAVQVRNDKNTSKCAAQATYATGRQWSRFTDSTKTDAKCREIFDHVTRFTRCLCKFDLHMYELRFNVSPRND